MRDVGVVHHETGQALVNRIVPGKLASIYERGKGGGGKGFGVRSDPEHGVLIHGGGIAKLAHTVALGDDDLPVFHYGQTDSGNLERFHGAGDVGIKVRRGSRSGRLAPKRMSQEKSTSGQGMTSREGMAHHNLQE